MNTIIKDKVRKLAKAVLPFYLFALLPLTSCSDFLEIEPLNEIILEKFWTEKADVENMIAGCYSGMESEGVIRRMMIWGEFRSENIGIGSNISNDANLEKILKENIDAQNAYTTWDEFYSIINRCNTVIKYAPEVAAKDPAYTESELQAHIAEVTGLRALCYFYLIRTFRDVPYSTTAFTDDDQKMDLPATPFSGVLDSLITSLEAVKDFAVKRYPTTKPLYQTGRITKDAIHAMLSEMYLWKKDYQNCIKYADLVIESKKAIAEENKNSKSSSYGKGGSSSSGDDNRLNGYPLVSDITMSGIYGNAYTTLFGSDDYAEAYNQEIIFQLIFDDDPRANSMRSNQAVNTFYGHAAVSIGLVAPSDYLIEDISKTSSRTIFADRNKMADARMYENCNTGSKAIAKFRYRSIQISPTSASSTPPSISYINNYAENFCGANWVIYRLSDIMLIKAEALAETLRDGTDQSTLDYNTPIINQAFTLVNAVNKRSVMEATASLQDTLLRSDYNTKAQMETLILQERQRELMFEGKRWYDLVRFCQREGSTQKLSQAALLKVTSGGSLIANKLAKLDAIYWPYNNDELKVNKNLVQNPAFGSGENSSYEKNY